MAKRREFSVPLCTTCIGGDYDGVFVVELLADIIEDRWFSEKVVNRYIEKSLYLASMQIHSLKSEYRKDHTKVTYDDMITSCSLQHVGD